MELTFFQCPICGNIVVKVKDASVPVVCCGKPMIKMQANTSDGANEKHLPKVEQKDNTIIVKIGEVEHPQTEAHHIEFIILETNKGHYLHNLELNTPPNTEFILTKDEKALNVYAYCNLHSLWKTIL